MKYHYRPTFNAKEFGAAEKRADQYWKRRKEKSPPDKGGDQLTDQKHVAVVLDHPARPAKS